MIGWGGGEGGSRGLISDSILGEWVKTIFLIKSRYLQCLLGCLTGFETLIMAKLVS